MKLTTALALVLFVLQPVLSMASLPENKSKIVTPSCLDEHNNTLAVDNQNVILWKTTTPNQTLKRSHVSGVIVKLYPDHSGHTHFSAKIGPNANDTVEVIYNMSFGQIKNLNVGMNIEACGDYITSNAPAGGYEASPDGAIVHWIHETNDANKHKAGFLIINQALYGYPNQPL